MGPRLGSRGKSRFACTHWISCALQWGRDLEVAESRNYSRRCRVRHGFNGAATWKSRKDKPDPGPGWVLLGLQWGRDLEVAESKYSRLHRIARSSFNGAATWKSRKAPSQTMPFEPGTYASMGPRLGSRGKGNVAERRAVYGRASMGPRLGSRGKISGWPPA